MKSLIAAACFLAASSVMAADLGNTTATEGAESTISALSSTQTIERSKKTHKKKHHKAKKAAASTM